MEQPIYKRKGTCLQTTSKQTFNNFLLQEKIYMYKNYIKTDCIILACILYLHSIVKGKKE